MADALLVRRFEGVGDLAGNRTGSEAHLAHADYRTEVDSQPPAPPAGRRSGTMPLTHKYGKVGFHMKTTIELPDALFVAVKKRAADERRPIRELIEEALRAQLAGRRPRKDRATPIRWVTAPGGLPPGIDVADRAAMHDGLRRQR